MLNYDDYKCKIEYPEKPQRPRFSNCTPTSKEVAEYAKVVDTYELALVEYTQNLLLYKRSETALEIQFKHDVLKAHGLDGHAKANRIYELAWERGHSYGLQAVECELAELAELVL